MEKKSQFIKEKAYLMQNEILFSNGLTFSSFDDDLGLKNLEYGETDMDSRSNRMSCSSVPSLCKIIKENKYDFIDTGTIKIKSINNLKMLTKDCRILCEFKLCGTFFGTGWKFTQFVESVDLMMRMVSSEINRNIKYYSNGKNICCYIY